MKKAIKINLSGIIFHIDEDAYEKLKTYLDTIGRHFSNKQESKEIIDDIEARIAELFQEKITEETQVITLPLVNEVIDIMGNPEDIADTGEEAESQRTFHEAYSRSRRLYRDPENSVIGGVCGGLAAYFNVDPVIFRLAVRDLFLCRWCLHPGLCHHSGSYSPGQRQPLKSWRCEGRK